MKNLIIILLGIVLFACDKIPDNIVDSELQTTQFNVADFNAPANFEYSETDSTIDISLKFESISDLKDLSFNVYNPSGSKVTAFPIEMVKSDADQLNYTGRYTFSKYDISGNYEFNFTAKTSYGANLPILIHHLKYKGENFPPVISNLVMADSVAKGEDFVFSVYVEDANGYDDIKLVYFHLYRPDGTLVDPGTGDTRFRMFDNGDISGSGDEVFGDGIFSLKNSFSNTAQTGPWKFEFESIDQNDSLSNKITHNILVQ